MAKEQENTDMPKKTLTFNGGDKVDEDFLNLCNEYANLPDNDGIPFAACLRNFFTRKLREALGIAHQKTPAGPLARRA